ncbi:tail fiber assembly protein [Escherichia coli]|uniref:tail fiber assembly protein n=1 Tax=Escherichia coli TaxID=562 RepID=UPI002350080C|nr:tail fiber assembly protein [Escherichia coli]MDC7907382.1 tail fiber assembly protein [Escherichia coli]
MKYFKSESGTVYAYEEDAGDTYIKIGLTEITEEEAMLLVNPAPTPEQLVAQAEDKRISLRSIADSNITWRQDAVAEGIATEQEKSDLAAWKKYRVLLMRVDTAAPVWPTIPAQ